MNHNPSSIESLKDNLEEEKFLNKELEEQEQNPPGSREKIFPVIVDSNHAIRRNPTITNICWMKQSLIGIFLLTFLLTIFLLTVYPYLFIPINNERQQPNPKRLDFQESKKNDKQLRRILTKDFTLESFFEDNLDPKIITKYKMELISNKNLNNGVINKPDLETCLKKYSKLDYISSSSAHTPALIYSMPNSGEILTRILLEYTTGFHTSTVYGSHFLINDFSAEKECSRNTIGISTLPSPIKSLSFDEGTISLLKKNCEFNNNEEIKKVLMINRNPFHSIAFDYLSKYIDFNFNNFDPLEFSYFAISMATLYKKLWKNEYGELKKKFQDNLLVINIEDINDPFIQVDMLKYIVDFLELKKKSEGLKYDLIKKVNFEFNKNQLNGIEMLYNDKIANNKTLPYLDDVLRKQNNSLIGTEDNDRFVKNEDNLSSISEDNMFELNRLKCSFVLAENKKKSMIYFQEYKLLDTKNYKTILYTFYNQKLLCFISKYLEEELKLYSYNKEISIIQDCSFEHSKLSERDIDRITSILSVTYNVHLNRKYYHNNYEKIKDELGHLI